MRIEVGSKFGRLVVIARGDRRGTNQYWVCECSCGQLRTVCAGNLLNGTSSCGCLRSENRASVTHGLTGSVEYGIWEGIKQRCLNPNRKKYCIYGGRGIKVCQRWLESFENFYKDMGPRPSRYHSIERRNNDGDYEPMNCYWATAVEQGENKRSTIRVTYRGNEYPLKSLCRTLGLKYSTVYHRLFKYDWSVERALS